ncbi:hypothetical protein [Sphingomonas sp.]|uniref:hypothetical protein n=1 Tax=Sphingomonas sp. TaxID=28214 RepID=UPI003B3A889E
MGNIEWLPIESAPKDDETCFLAWGPNYGAQVVFYHPSDAPALTTHDGVRFEGSEWYWAIVDGNTLHKDTFTHWAEINPPGEIDKGITVFKVRDATDDVL